MAQKNVKVGWWGLCSVCLIGGWMATQLELPSLACSTETLANLSAEPRLCLFTWAGLPS